MSIDEIGSVRNAEANILGLSDFASKEDEEGVLDDAEENETSVEAPVVKYEISSYGADYPVGMLVEQLETKDIFIPDFQRAFVWSQAEASRFVESLLLGFPVPAIFLAKQSDNRFLVVDGQQRLRTLHSFRLGVFRGHEFKLQGVNPEHLGKTYRTLTQDDRRRLDNSIMHAIILQQEEPKEDNSSSIYLLFERLNTGGRLLHPQEIRACISHGAFIELLGELNDLAAWRKLYGPKSQRLKDQELILRFFALYYKGDKYEAPMKSFLDNFINENGSLTKLSAGELKHLFETTMVAVQNSIGDKAFRPVKAFNAAVFDSISIGLARRLSRGSINKAAEIRKQYDALLKNDKFVSAYERATAREENVSTRTNLATAAFADVA
jgi:hypothetical protein